MDQDQQWLLNCLSATLDPNPEVRCFAEASLDQASRQPGFGSALSKVTANKELAVGLRQLAAVLIKQLVKKHWQEGEDTFEPPVISTDEKEIIRRMLLLALDDPHRKICTAIGMAVASIAVHDWPELWPDLLPFLLNLINNQANLNGVHGAMRCLTLLCSDLDDQMVPTLIPSLFPSLLTIVSSPQKYDKYIRSKALSIIYSCTSMLGTMSGVYKAETSSLIAPLLKPWMGQFSSILEIPVQSENPDDWSIRMEVLKCLNQFIQNFSSLFKSEFEVILGPLWNTFVSSLRVYEKAAIEGTEDSYDGRYDSDGSEKSLDSFVIQLFELMLTIVGNTRLKKVVGANIRELVYYTIAFLQMTEQQVHTWSADANQFIADEEDATYSCRISGVLLLEEVVNSYDDEGICAIIDSTKQWFNESQIRKAAGNASWWRIREATLYALSSLSEQLFETEETRVYSSDLKHLLEQIFAVDSLIGPLECPFLYARIFTSVAKFSSLISSGLVEHYLYLGMKAVTIDVPPPVKVGACRALSNLLPEATNEVIQSQLLGLFSSLIDLLNHASEETLHMVLDTLLAAVKAGRESSTVVENMISPVILNVWASHVSDPFISIDALEILETIKSIPGCIHPLVSRILPYVGPILNKPQEQTEGLVAGSLDLVTMLLKNAPADVVKAIYDVSFNAVIKITLQSDDHSEIQNATECLSAFISGGRQEILAWGSDSGSIMRSLLDIASRLLNPELESSGSLFVGSYILQLILHLPSHMAVHIRDLVAALVKRMQSAQNAVLRSSLLIVFARLVHMSVPNVGDFIDLMISIPADGHDNSFAYVISEWTKLQGDIQGAYQIKVTTSALALLLTSRHNELGKIHVQGHLIKSGEGVTTRSKAKSAPNQWVILPLPTKIVALLADALTEIQEQVLEADVVDSDWEEVEADGIENDRDFLYSVSSPLGKATDEHLQAMAKVFNEDRDDQYDDNLFSVADPLNQINLANYLVDFFVSFSQSDRQLLDHICQSLTQSQRNAIQMVLKR
ncbi:importin-9 [Vigna unguiculata]|uniref:importin-9 n=1 Tax=Vigna unguiculata TaxID=3917 RepID=UPI001016D518|nr:importin-9 [Vigna unguiculata]